MRQPQPTQPGERGRRPATKTAGVLRSALLDSICDWISPVSIFSLAPVSAAPLSVVIRVIGDACRPRRCISPDAQQVRQPFSVRLVQPGRNLLCVRSRLQISAARHIGQRVLERERRWAAAVECGQRQGPMPLSGTTPPRLRQLGVRALPALTAKVEQGLGNGSMGDGVSADAVQNSRR